MTVEARPADARALGGGLAGRLRGPRFQHVMFGVVLLVLLDLMVPPAVFLLRGSLSGVRGTASGDLNEAARAVFGPGVGFDVFSMAGMVLVETLFWIPVVFLLMAVPLRSMDPSLEEAGAMSGAGPPRVLWSITLRLALPAILS